MRQETKKCPKCKKLMIVVLGSESAVPGCADAFWRCGCGHRDWAGTRKLEGEPDWLLRWREVNRV